MKNSLFKKYKAVAYLPTAYTIFQYMLLQPYRIEDTLFLINRSCQKKLISRLPNYLVLENPYIDSRLISRVFFFIKAYRHFLLIYFLSKRSKIVFLSSHSIILEACIYHFSHIVYLEDGWGSYLQQEVNVKRRGRLWEVLFGPSYPCHGWADKVEKIYLTGLLPIPEGIANKVELFNLKELWGKRSPVEQQQIIRLFLPEGIESISCLDIDTLLLTQPLSEDIDEGFTEVDKIELYRELLSGIDEQTVVIKVHPREKTDYRKYFPCATVLNALCPMELLEILGMKVRKAITVNSTAIYNLDNSVEKVIAAETPSPKVTRAITLL